MLKVRVAIVSVICGSCLCAGCESSPKYGVGTRGDIKPFETPQALIESYNKAYSIGQIPPAPMANGELSAVRLVPDMPAYYTPADSEVKPDFEAVSHLCSADFELLYSVSQQFGRKAAKRSSFHLLNDRLGDLIEVSTLVIHDDGTAVVKGNIWGPRMDGSPTSDRQELTYDLAKTPDGWKIIFHDEPKGKESLGRSIIMGVGYGVSSCLESVTKRVDQDEYKSMGEVETAVDQCGTEAFTHMQDWMQKRRATADADQ